MYIQSCYAEGDFRRNGSTDYGMMGLDTVVLGPSWQMSISSWVTLRSGRLFDGILGQEPEVCLRVVAERSSPLYYVLSQLQCSCLPPAPWLQQPCYLFSSRTMA